MKELGKAYDQKRRARLEEIRRMRRISGSSIGELIHSMFHLFQDIQSVYFTCRWATQVICGVGNPWPYLPEDLGEK